MIEEIILHRTQDIFGELNLCSSFDRGYAMGFRSFEIDLYDFNGLEIQIKHPCYIQEMTVISNFSDVINWAKEKDVRIYLDIKYPLKWKRSFDEWFEVFCNLDQKKFLIFSFDIEIITPIIQKTGLSYGSLDFRHILNERNDFYIIPASYCESILNVSYKKVIISGINYNEQINHVLNLGYSRIMLNTPDLLKQLI